MSARSDKILVAVSIVLTIVFLAVGFLARAKRADLANLTKPAVTATRSENADVGVASSQSLPSTSPATQTVPPPRPTRVNPYDLLGNDSEGAAQWLRSREAMMAVDYRPLFQRWDLPADLQRAVLEILAKKFRADSENAWASPQPRSAEAEAALQVLRDQAAAVRDNELKTLLGSERQAEFDVYARELPARRYVHGLAARVAFTEPLSLQQADQLTAMIARASPIFVNGKPAYLQEVQWEELDDRAAEILSPAQFDAWKGGMVRDLRGGQTRAAMTLTREYEKALEREKTGR